MKKSAWRSRTAWVTGLLLLMLAALAAWLLAIQPGSLSWRAPGTERWRDAGIATAAYLLFCLALGWRRRARRRAAGVLADDAVLVVHSSQTGHAEQLAQQTAQALIAAQVPAQAIALHELSAERLLATRKALFIASTTGEGDAPDGALHFIREVMAAEPVLDLEYGLLALGDREYQQFCAWGRRLDQWLQGQGATAAFERIEVNNADPEALQRWRAQLAGFAGRALDQWKEPEFSDWTLVERRWLNPGSAGAPCFHVVLRPQQAMDWSAGDVMAVALPGEPAVLRDYSIASLPADGAVHLLVRQARRADGSLGLGSGWLTQHAPLGSALSAQLRVNQSFHVPDDDRPMILIANGTGIAGLRALLKARAAAGHSQNWLLFGERQAEHDFHYRDELQAWQAQGLLQHLDLAFSRDGERRVYVQDRLHEQAPRLREWIARGAAIYVCGSAQGMATGVDGVLRAALGDEALDGLRDAQRYRRDVY